MYKVHAFYVILVVVKPMYVTVVASHEALTVKNAIVVEYQMFAFVIYISIQYLSKIHFAQ